MIGACVWGVPPPYRALADVEGSELDVALRGEPVAGVGPSDSDLVHLEVAVSPDRRGLGRDDCKPKRQG